MAVVVRFSTLIVRKAAFPVVGDRTLSTFRQEVQKDTSTYYEDSNLIAVSSMNGHERFETRMSAYGLTADNSKDITYASLLAELGARLA